MVQSFERSLNRQPIVSRLQIESKVNSFCMIVCLSAVNIVCSRTKKEEVLYCCLATNISGEKIKLVYKPAYIYIKHTIGVKVCDNSLKKRSLFIQK